MWLRDMLSLIMVCMVMIFIGIIPINTVEGILPIDALNTRGFDRNLRYSIDSASLPQLADTDLLELYHVRSFPHLTVASQVGSFSIQTAGLAFRGTSTSDVVLFMYEPLNYSACFVPMIGENGTLEWDTRAVVNVGRHLDIAYWQQSTFLAHVNGVVYANFIQWVSRYIARHPNFIFHSVCSGTEEESCFTHGHTWDNFVADCMIALANLAVKMRAILPPRATRVELVSHVEPLRFSPQISVNETELARAAKAGQGFLQLAATAAGASTASSEEQGRTILLQPSRSLADNVGDRSIHSSTRYSENEMSCRDQLRFLISDTVFKEKKGISGASSYQSLDIRWPFGEHGLGDDATEDTESTVLYYAGSSSAAAEDDNVHASPGQRSSIIDQHQARAPPVDLPSIASDANPSSNSALQGNELSDSFYSGSMTVNSGDQLNHELHSRLGVPDELNDSSSLQLSGALDAAMSDAGINSSVNKSQTEQHDGFAFNSSSNGAENTEKIAASNASSIQNSTNITGLTNISKPTGSDWIADKPVASIIDNVPTLKLRTNVTQADITLFYIKLLTCMQEYQLESFSSAYRSCISEEKVAFVYIAHNKYYQILPRYPFVYDLHYFQSIPAAVYSLADETTRADVLIGLLLISALFAGFLVGAWKLNIFQWWKEKSSQFSLRFRKRPKYAGFINPFHNGGISPLEPSSWRPHINVNQLDNETIRETDALLGMKNTSRDENGKEIELVGAERVVSGGRDELVDLQTPYRLPPLMTADGVGDEISSEDMADDNECSSPRLRFQIRKPGDVNYLSVLNMDAHATEYPQYFNWLADYSIKQHDEFESDITDFGLGLDDETLRLRRRATSNA